MSDINENAIVAYQPGSLLAKAVEKNVELDKLEKLMDLQERWIAGEAKNAFNNALCHFQAEAPEIKKTKSGYDDRYKFADLDDIMKEIRPLLSQNNLSIRFEQNQTDTEIAVTCFVTHIQGHSESTAMKAMADTSGGKNSIQAVASTITYLRRYTLTGALGLTTGTEDDDGGKPSVTVEDLLLHNKVLRENLQTMATAIKAIEENDYSTAKESLNELEHEDRTILWRATTKGGIFTTEQRELMKSTAWREA